MVRVHLDGSHPHAVSTDGLHNPNDVTVIDGDVYYVDSHYKTRGDTYTGKW